MGRRQTDRGSQASEEAPSAQGQSRVPAEQTGGAAQPKDCLEVGEPAPLGPKSRSDVESGDGEAEAGSSLSRSPEAGHLGD